MIKRLAAAALLMLALTGCTPAAPAPARLHTTAVAPASLVEAVQQGWEGAEVPDERWITTAATLACKQIIGGFEPRVVMDHAANNELVVSAAEQFVCERSRVG